MVGKDTPRLSGKVTGLGGFELSLFHSRILRRFNSSYFLIDMGKHRFLSLLEGYHQGE